MLPFTDTRAQKYSKGKPAKKRRQCLNFQKCGERETCIKFILVIPFADSLGRIICEGGKLLQRTLHFRYSLTDIRSKTSSIPMAWDMAESFDDRWRVPYDAISAMTR